MECSFVMTCMASYDLNRFSPALVHLLMTACIQTMLLIGTIRKTTGHTTAAGGSAAAVTAGHPWGL